MLKGKLSPIDNTLPLLIQLIAAGMTRDITLIVTSREFWRILQEEQLIATALKQNQIRIIAPKKGEGIFDRLVRLAQMAWTLCPALFRKRWLLNFGEGGRAIKLLALWNHLVWGGTSFMVNLSPLNIETHRHINKVMCRHFGRQPVDIYTKGYDAVLTSIPKEEYPSQAHTETPFISLGYGRGFPAWKEFLDQQGRNGFETGIGKHFFFWPLSVLRRSEKHGDPVDILTSIRETILILKELDYPLQTVFRYHPTTDRKQFLELLKDIGFNNFAISFCHPHQLIRHSRFTFSTVGTSLFCDAWYLGKPVIQYISTAASFVEIDRSGTPISSVYQPVVDEFIAMDRCKFKKVLISLACGDYKLKRTDRQENTVGNLRPILQEFL
jgi:hypothetical protein